MPNENRTAETVCSYLSVHEGLSKKYKMYTSKYAQFVIDYAVEWEKVVVARVTAALKKAEELRRVVRSSIKKEERFELKSKPIWNQKEKSKTK